MEKVIRKYLEGDFCYVPGILEFSCPRLELNLKPGQMYRGSFRITASGQGQVQGRVLSHQNRMTCENPLFKEKEAEIFYTFDSRGMEEGEVLQGQFEILSNQGEYTLPYVVNLEYFRLPSSMGDIKNLFHFANLAKTSWDEAVRLFYLPEFIGIFRGNDEQYRDCYRLLAAAPANQASPELPAAGEKQAGEGTAYVRPESGRSVEEFLLEIRKKQPIEYVVEQKELAYQDLAGVSAEILEITRNGWGYTRLSVQAEGAFLSLEKDVLTEDDFLGNLCKCVFYVDAKALHAGVNFGALTLQSPHQTIRIPVTVKSAARRQTGRVQSHKKRLTYQLMQQYLAYRMHRISADVWLEETSRLMDDWNAVDNRSAACQLFRIQLLLTTQRCNEAGWMLERVEPLLGGEQEHPDAVYCYYLYLTSLLKQDAAYTRQIARKIRGIYGAEPGNWRIAWLLLYLDEEYERSPSRKWVFLEELFSHGVSSPVFYLEAMLLVRDNPALLMRPGGFEIQVLLYGAKNGLLTDDLIRQIHYLAGRLKTGQKHLFTILRACYRQSGDDESLQAICTLLIRDGRAGEAYFPWYEKAVERELRIMRLYEYYMMSLPEHFAGEIPRMVLMYFAYRSSLDGGLGSRQNAQLYAYVARHGEDQPEMLRTYQADMEKFIRQQLSAGKIDRNLAYLYRHRVTEEMRRQMAPQYVRAAFSCCVRVEDSDIRSVIVRYGKKKDEETYPVTDGAAYVPLYGEDYTLCLQDGQGFRRAAGSGCQIEKLLMAGSALRDAAAYVSNDLNLDLYCCQGSRHYTSVDERNAVRAARAAACPEVEDRYRQELKLLLLQYYYDRDMELQLDLLLQELEPEGMSAAQRGEALRYLVLREQDAKALAWLRRYGTSGLDPKTIVRLCGRVLESGDYADDASFRNVIYYAFRRGKYSERILTYLVAHFAGSTKQMRDIWKAAASFDVETYPLEERILLQILYTEGYVGEGVQIFASYVEKTPRTDIALAYLSYLSFEYFVRDKVMEPFAWKLAAQMYAQKETLPFVVRAAWLRHLSEQTSLSEEEREAAAALGEGMLRQGMFFSFFRRFTGLHPVFDSFLDKTILEYRARPDSKVVMHYLLEKEQSGKPRYRTEEMRHMYGGIFVREFVLFFGETLQYYITEESDGKSTLTASGTLTGSETGREMQDTRYGMISDIVTAWALQDYDTVDGLLQEFYEKDYVIGRLFRPK